MNPTPFPFEDFRRAKQRLQRALIEHHEPFVLLTGETGTGKPALLRELRAKIDRTRYRVVYFAQARKLGAVGLIKVLEELDAFLAHHFPTPLRLCEQGLSAMFEHASAESGPIDPTAGEDSLQR